VEYADYSSDDDYRLDSDDNEISDEISNYSGGSTAIEDENNSDSQTTIYTSSSDDDDDESNLSSFDINDDNDEVNSSYVTFKEEEELIQKAYEDSTILSSKIHILLKRTRKLISMILNTSALNRYVNKEIKLKLKEEKANKQLGEENKNDNQHKGLIKDMKIRWNSTYVMLNRVVKYSSIINCLTHDPPAKIGLKSGQCRTLRKLSFSSLDWTILKAVEHVLSPFDHATKTLSIRSKPTLSFIPSVLYVLMNFLEASDGSSLSLENLLKKHLLLVFNHYYEKHVTVDQRMATLVSRDLSNETELNEILFSYDLSR
jgi:hypothetical protein